MNVLTMASRPEPPSFSGSVSDAHPALEAASCAGLPRPNDHPSARRVRNGVGDHILEDPPQQAGVCIDDQVFGHLIDYPRVRGQRYRIEIVNQGLDQRP